MLLTSCPVKTSQKESVWRIVEYYLARWKCDESYRYIKQCYRLEDVRVRSYISIRNIVVLVLAVSYFASVYLGQNIKLNGIYLKQDAEILIQKASEAQA